MNSIHVPHLNRINLIRGTIFHLLIELFLLDVRLRKLAGQKEELLSQVTFAFLKCYPSNTHAAAFIRFYFTEPSPGCD